MEWLVFFGTTPYGSKYLLRRYFTPQFCTLGAFLAATWIHKGQVIRCVFIVCLTLLSANAKLVVWGPGGLEFPCWGGTWKKGSTTNLSCLGVGPKPTTKSSFNRCDSGDEAILPLPAVCNTYREWCPSETCIWRFWSRWCIQKTLYILIYIYMKECLGMLAHTCMYHFRYTKYLNSVFIHLKQTAVKQSRDHQERDLIQPGKMLVWKCRPEVAQMHRFSW